MVLYLHHTHSLSHAHPTQIVLVSQCLSMVGLWPSSMSTGCVAATEGRSSHFFQTGSGGSDWLAEYVQPRENPLKYSTATRNWTRATKMTNSEIHLSSHWAIMTDIVHYILLYLQAGGLVMVVWWPSLWYFFCWLRFLQSSSWHSSATELSDRKIDGSRSPLFLSDCDRLRIICIQFYSGIHLPLDTRVISWKSGVRRSFKTYFGTTSLVPSQQADIAPTYWAYRVPRRLIELAVHRFSNRQFLLHSTIAFK